MNFHFNSQKRYLSENQIYFITSNTYHRFPYFRNKVVCDLFIEELKIRKEIKEFKLYGFCILPNHIHLMISSSEKSNISRDIHFLKRNFAYNINHKLLSDNPINESDNAHCRFRKIDRKFTQQQQTFLSLPTFRWQKSYHDHIIRNEIDFQNHLQYIWYNPVKHHLTTYTKDYYYSSLNQQFNSLIDIMKL